MKEMIHLKIVPAIFVIQKTNPFVFRKNSELLKTKEWIKFTPKDNKKDLIYSYQAKLNTMAKKLATNKKIHNLYKIIMIHGQPEQLMSRIWLSNDFDLVKIVDFLLMAILCASVIL